MGEWWALWGVLVESDGIMCGGGAGMAGNFAVSWRGVSFISSFGELPSIYPQKSLFFIGNMFDFKVGVLGRWGQDGWGAGLVRQVLCSA